MSAAVSVLQQSLLWEGILPDTLCPFFQLLQIAHSLNVPTEKKQKKSGNPEGFPDL